MIFCCVISGMQNYVLNIFCFVCVFISYSKFTYFVDKKPSSLTAHFANLPNNARMHARGFFATLHRNEIAVVTDLQQLLGWSHLSEANSFLQKDLLVKRFHKNTIHLSCLPYSLYLTNIMAVGTAN